MSSSTSSGPDYGTGAFTGSPSRTGLQTNTPAGDGRSTFRTSVIALDRPGNPNVFEESIRADAAELIARYPPGAARSALGPMLHLVQSVQGQITPDGIAFCAERTGLTKAQVAAFATFYTMYKRVPTGDYLISVCTNTLCGLLGGDEIYACLQDELGIGNNQTSADGSFTLEHAECLAACDYAPVITVNYEFFDNQTVASARDLVSRLGSGDRPEPTRGAPLCTFKQTSRQIAGFFDETTFAQDAPNSGVPTERGVALAIERGESAPSYAMSDSHTAADGTGTTNGTPSSTAGAGAAPPTASGGTAGGGTGDAEAAAARATSQPTSDHDAPLETAESDSSNTTAPGASKD